MYQSRHTTSNKKAVSKRRMALIVSIVLLLTCTVGGTLAYFTDSDASKSSFGVGEVSCTAEIANGEASNAYTVTVTNTGTVPAYIRLAVVASWVSESEPNAVYYTEPQIVLDASENWKKKENEDFYYYKSTVSAGGSVTFKVDTSSAGTLTGYKLKLEALAEAIQENAAAEAWGYTPSED